MPSMLYWRRSLVEIKSTMGQKRLPLILILTLLCHRSLQQNAITNSTIPLVINTWAFTKATYVAWQTLTHEMKSAIDAIEAGCTKCEDLQCDHTVGYGGSPDENGESTLDAMIFDGDTMNMGAVGGLRRIKHASSVARKVLEQTEHSILVGELATAFAKKMGFVEESLSTSYSSKIYEEWKSKSCQPNFWTDVTPDPKKDCGPYKPVIKINEKINDRFPTENRINVWNHDTISMVIIDKNGSIVAGTSSNGANHKIPGRVGDAPIPGAGAYADSKVGAAVATGDGDIMMRFLPSSTIVEMMRNGIKPKAAVDKLIRRIASYYKNFSGAIIAVNKDGEYAASCHGIKSFPYSLVSSMNPVVTVQTVTCI
ncbi:N(4)-(Beta-N-acetylglucosaminyl)-L-asparaginase isoform X2 [Cimex lectularius]|uniref:N(4)-(beta-N-acetylglucosaminyl)-L-asparaginase n=1 Tax=Cimex lectularius TaxID=79782 RepID=A0A8I6RH45_CIMLE|nr:N(4)-(Beta-N-acetylglucosaminyl)-L-asparaginase isoform X2 [Cimex lectularius]